MFVIGVFLVLMIAIMGAYIVNLKRLGVKSKSLDWVVNASTLATFASGLLGIVAGIVVQPRYPANPESGLVVGLAAMIGAWVPCFIIGLVPTKLSQLATTGRVLILGCGKHSGDRNLLMTETSLLGSER